MHEFREFFLLGDSVICRLGGDCDDCDRDLEIWVLLW